MDPVSQAMARGCNRVSASDELRQTWSLKRQPLLLPGDSGDGDGVSESEIVIVASLSRTVLQ